MKTCKKKLKFERNENLQKKIKNCKKWKFAKNEKSEKTIFYKQWNFRKNENCETAKN